MRIAAVDPAITATNIGIAFLDDQERVCSFPKVTAAVVGAAEQFRQHWRDADGGNQYAVAAARELARFLQGLQPNIVVVDAPQAFSHPGKNRRAEKLLRTSAWTSDIFEVPKRGFSGPALVRLGIHIFDNLAQRGFARLQSPGIEDNSAVEVFPDASWHSFGCDAKGRDDLSEVWAARNWRFDGDASEHDLDAAIGGFSVVAALDGHGVFIGEPADMDAGGVWREGFIVIPDPTTRWRLSTSFEVARNLQKKDIE